MGEVKEEVQSEKTGEEEKGASSIVSQEDLVKSMQKLEGAKAEADAEEEQVLPEVAEIVLAKSVDELAGNEGLQKALDVSEPLAQMSDSLENVMDAALESMEKNANHQNAFQLSLLTTMENMAVQLEALTKKVDEFGTAPMRPRSSQGGPAASNNSGRDLLLKHAGAGGGEEGSKEAPREEVLRGLVELAKNAKGPEDEQHWAKATSIFETTAQIDDGDLKKAIAAASSNGAG